VKIFKYRFSDVSLARSLLNYNLVFRVLSVGLKSCHYALLAIFIYICIYMYVMYIYMCICFNISHQGTSMTKVFCFRLLVSKQIFMDRGSYLSWDMSWIIQTWRGLSVLKGSMNQAFVYIDQ
jgi:hypothetical protein